MTRTFGGSGPAARRPPRRGVGVAGGGGTEPLDRASLVRLLRRAWPMLYPQRRDLALVFALTVASTVLSLAGPWFLKYGIDQGATQGDKAALSRAAGGFAVVMLLGIAVGGAQIRTLNRVGQRFLRQLRSDVFRHLQRLSLEFYDQHRTGVLVSRMTGDIETLGALVSNGLPMLLTSAVMLVVSLVFLAVVSWQLTLVCLTVLPLLVVSSRKFQRDADAAYLDVRDDVASLLSEVQEGVSGVRVTQAFGQEETMIRRCAEANEVLYSTHMRSAWVQSWYLTVIEFSGIATAALIVGVGGWMAATGAATVGTVTLFLLTISNVFEPVQQLSQLFNTLQSAGAGLKKLFGILDTEPTVTEQPGAVALPATGALVVDRVGFRYPSPPEDDGAEPDADGHRSADADADADPGATFALAGVSLELRAGQRLALVGPTGAGKSTLAKLLARLYDPSEGVISFGGLDLRDATIGSLHRRILMVPQEGFLFGASIFENVHLARPEASEAEVVDALRSVGALERFERLPDGLGTQVEQRGSRLSAGEKQLISLARVFLADPAVLILDEATSNLDPGLERVVNEAVDRLSHQRITVVIAHRLATAEHASLVGVVTDGALIEVGPPAELASRPGPYRELWEAWMRNAGVEPVVTA